MLTFPFVWYTSCDICVLQLPGKPLIAFNALVAFYVWILSVVCIQKHLMETSTCEHKHDNGLSKESIVKRECGLLVACLDKMQLFSCFILPYFSIGGWFLILILV